MSAQNDFDATIRMTPDGAGGQPQMPQQPGGSGFGQPYDPTQINQPMGGGPAWGGAGGYGGASSATETVILRPRGPVVLAWLVVASGPFTGHIFPLNPDGSILGRDQRADIFLQDEYVGSLHAKVWVEGTNEDGASARYVIQDLASKNRTFVNDAEVLKAELKDGDRIQAGNTLLVFKQI